MTYEFDVAFSFHSHDEGLATQLNDLLQDRFKTFLYSEEQEMLAGTDGEERFNAVFGKKARCVVVLCRKEWGETPFTRIEQTAIRNRAFNEGYEFTIFIPTDKPPTIPPWLPKTRLHIGLDRYGLSGAAAVIEARVQELGGEPRVESLTDRAARSQRAREFEDARKRFRESADGVRMAQDAFVRLTSVLETKAAEIAASYESLANLKIRKSQDYWMISGLGVCVVIHWGVRYRNSLDGSLLRAELYKGGIPRLPGFIGGLEEPRRLNSMEFEYQLFAIDRHGYVERAGERRRFSPEDLAEYFLRRYIDAAEKHALH
jgi:hypothetical protein